MLAIPGLSLIPDYITPQQETDLAAHIDSQPWITDLRRRVQHYGYIYDYRRRTVDPSMYLGALPTWLSELAQRLHGEQHFPAEPDQCIINEYEPGQGIRPHVDCEPCFGDVVASLSLLSSCVMTFTQVSGDAHHEIVLPARSLLIMRGSARYEWKHGIPARQKDVVPTETLVRGRRLSITCRTVVVSDGVS